MPARISRDSLGCWVVRSNPLGATDLFAAVRRGERRIDRWCVTPNYRSAMMRADDPIVLWVTGDGRRVVRGLWGAGQVTGGAEQHAAGDGRLTVPVDIGLFDNGVSDGELRDAGIDDLEVQRQPMGSNPSWVSAGQMLRLSPLLTASSASAVWPSAGLGSRR